MFNYSKPLLVLLMLLVSAHSVKAHIIDTVKKKIDSSKYRKYPENRYSLYEPNYFLSNFGQNYFGQVKFKISFKYDLSFGSKKDKVYFAYTQYAYWNIYQPSAPMKELDFTPTLFYEHDFKNKLLVGDKWHFRFIDVKGGYLHQSDGQPEGPYNRSVFKITANADMELTRNQASQWWLGLDAVSFSIRTWIWNMVDADNYNIADYQGYGQFITTFKFDYHCKAFSTYNKSYPIEINYVLTPAKAALSNELNLSFNPFIGHVHSGWVPYLMVQYFHGYGESLINYDSRYTGGKVLNEYRMGVQFRVY